MIVDEISDKQLQLLASPWAATFYDLIRLAQEDLLITSPFISGEPIRKLVGIISEKPSLRLHIVTNLAIKSLLDGSLDIFSLTNLVEMIPSSKLTYLPSLHAKVYIADNKAAIITSGNLTNNGLIGNREYGVLLRNSADIIEVRSDLTNYANLGNVVSLDTLKALSAATHDLKEQRQRAEKSINAKLRKIFEQRTNVAKVELLKARAKGKTTHGIFCDTVLYLLESRGPLTTVELHPLTQQIHPDLCDDTIDRVIDGVHFGKKWKHYIRNAQQALKRQGLIDFDGARWFIK